MYYKAVKMALESHHGQKRKLGGDPYVIHPLEVGFLLGENGADQATVIAGILHDVLEDTLLTKEDIEALFNTRILNLVVKCTEPDKSKPWKERKDGLLDQLHRSQKDVKMIFCADKLSNLKSISADLEALGDDLWHRFNAGYDKQKWFYGAIIEALVDLSDLGMYQDLKAYYRRVFKVEPLI